MQIFRHLEVMEFHSKHHIANSLHYIIIIASQISHGNRIRNNALQLHNIANIDLQLHRIENIAWQFYSKHCISNI
jgi:hypothetical protein